MRLQSVSKYLSNKNNNKKQNVNFNGIYRFVIFRPDEAIDVSREYTMTNFSRIFQEMLATFKKTSSFVLNPGEEQIKAGKKIHLQFHEDKFPPAPHRALNLFTGPDADMYLKLKDELSHNPNYLKAFFHDVKKDNVFIIENFYQAWSTLEDVLIEIKRNSQATTLKLFNTDSNLNWRSILANSALNKETNRLPQQSLKNFKELPFRQLAQDATKQNTN
jgi:hypothetical protein